MPGLNVQERVSAFNALSGDTTGVEAQRVTRPRARVEGLGFRVLGFRVRLSRLARSQARLQISNTRGSQDTLAPTQEQQAKILSEGTTGSDPSINQNNYDRIHRASTTEYVAHSRVKGLSWNTRGFTP